jgi:hypothetical protein
MSRTLTSNGAVPSDNFVPTLNLGGPTVPEVEWIEVAGPQGPLWFSRDYYQDDGGYVRGSMEVASPILERYGARLPANQAEVELFNQQAQMLDFLPSGGGPTGAEGGFAGQYPSSDNFDHLVSLHNEALGELNIPRDQPVAGHLKDLLQGGYLFHPDQGLQGAHTGDPRYRDYSQGIRLVRDSPPEELAAIAADPATPPAQAAAAQEQLLQIYAATRADHSPNSGLNISMDFNAASSPAFGTEVIIPDNATPEVRAAAENFNQLVAQFAADNGYADYPIRGVRTRSENGRGVRNTVHTEPFFNNDIRMQRLIQENPAAFAEIYRTAFGGIDGRLIAPHGVGADRGAVSEVFGTETEFGMMMANALLNGEVPATPENVAAAEVALNRDGSASLSNFVPGLNLGTTASTRTPERAGTTNPNASIQEQVYNGLISRGMPEHIAQGFMMNFQSESNFDPSVVERVPNTHGTRGRGLYQLTGSRRRQFEERFGSGADAYTIDNQLDFLMWELENTEGRAWRNLQNTTDPGEAGAIITRDFLRPAAQHRDRRMAEYRSGGGYRFTPSGDVVPIAAPASPQLIETPAGTALSVDAIAPATLDTWTSSQNPDISLTTNSAAPADEIAAVAQAIPEVAPVTQNPQDIIAQLTGVSAGGFMMPQDIGGTPAAPPAVAVPSADADIAAAAGVPVQQESTGFQVPEEFQGMPEPTLDEALLSRIEGDSRLTRQQRTDLTRQLRARHERELEMWRTDRSEQRRNLEAILMQEGIRNLDLTNPREASEWVRERARSTGLYDDADLLGLEAQMFDFFGSGYAQSRMNPSVPADPSLGARRESAVQSGSQAVRNTDLGQIVSRSERYAEDPAGSLISDFEEFGSSEWSRREIDLMIDDFAQQFGVSREIAASAMYESFQEQVLPQNWGESAIAGLPLVGLDGFERMFGDDLERRFRPEVAEDIIRSNNGDAVSVPQAFQDFNHAFAEIERNSSHLQYLESEIMYLRSQALRIQETLGEDSSEFAEVQEQLGILMEQYGSIANDIQNIGRR